MRSLVLHELLKIDLDHRWGRGATALLEEYAARFPELGETKLLPPDLICEEYRARKKHGDAFELASYERRFPGQFAAVTRELANEVPSTRHSEVDVSSVVNNNQVASPHASELPKSPGKFEMVERLGHGHFGEVWRARNAGGIEVAVKIVTQPIDRDAAQRELKSLELVKNLRHPCLLSTHTYFFDNNRLHIVMELADGSLRDRLKQCKKASQSGIARDELLMYFADAAEGIDFLHLRKLVHRDIKPDNIMLLHGHAKIADFGLARLQERQLMTMSFAGTPVYMAPEAWGGKGGPPSDQYSLAFSYAELRQGKRPVEGNDFTEVMGRTLEGEPDLSGIPGDEVKILKRALSKKPEERFGNCSEFVAALAKATGTPLRIRSPVEVALRGGDDADEVRTFKEPTDPEVDLPYGSRRLLLMAVLLILFAGVGLAAWNYLIRGTSSNSQKQANGTDRQRSDESTVKKDALAKDDKKTDGPGKDLPPWIPAKFVADPKAPVQTVGARRLARRIVFKLKNGDEAAFVLLRPPTGRPFYIMESKVWDAFYGELAGTNVARGFLPATGITVDQAYQFATALGGNLPTS
jgi:serine/threonine protein kinase